ncbi:Killer toxin, Kp4 [Mycena sanguinolenta]|uniref:Killer toxin, Kp4 n=1 Tax=Mycena sanguinolenta TaxID=230812 RepID=A0A8H6XC38_9AGAR|nr:Killer toxin, Kp4 [Mycena sanguinolenta]
MRLSSPIIISVTAAATAPWINANANAKAIVAKSVSGRLGINCEGSMKCNGQSHDTAKLLVAYIDGIDSERYYGNGEHIACRGNICAFLQGVPGPMRGEDIKNLAPAIVNHGCTVCGSVPTGPDNNDRYGQLTFNYVNDAACGEGGMC